MIEMEDLLERFGELPLDWGWLGFSRGSLGYLEALFDSLAPSGLIVEASFGCPGTEVNGSRVIGSVGEMPRNSQ